ncbi:MAG: hypothetical protein U9R79_21995 [Armatimonadota bacterium]|nr:hypothetical protein [Armatimonadota bacterium]
MRDRRQGRTILTVLAILAIIGTLFFLGQIFAQQEPPGMPPGEAGGPPGGEPGAMPPGEMGMGGEMGMMGGEMGMMGGGMGGAAAPAGGLRWQSNTEQFREELLMTYEEFLDETGQPRALIPDAYLYDEEDNPEEYTETQWMQLQRIYAGRRVVEEVAVTAGKPGFGLATRLNREIAVKQKELDAVRHLYEVGLNSFTFEIGYPQVRSEDIRPGTSNIPIQVGVIMKPKPGIEKRFPSLVYRKLKPFDHYGTDRQLFHIVDYEGGIFNPKKVWLWNGAVAEWNSLWGQNSVELTLYDVAGDDIVSATQGAGLTGGICANLVHPHDLNYGPMPGFSEIRPPRDLSFEGGSLDLDYKRGWYFSFSFNVPLGQLSALDRAEAVLIGTGGLEGSRGATQAPPPGAGAFEAASSRAAAAAGAERAMGAARTGLPMMGQQIPPGFY